MTGTPTSTPSRTATASQVATPTATTTRTATATATPTATAIATPGITFIGHSSLSDAAQPISVVTVSLPSGVRYGDVLLAQIVVYDGTGSNVPSPPAGWTLIRRDTVTNGNSMTSWLYDRVAGSSEPASYSWDISPQYAAGVIGAWRGASLSPIDKSSGATAAGASPLADAAPSLTPSNDDELQVYFYGSQSYQAPAVSEPGAIISRLDSMSAKEGFTLAFGDLAAPSEGNPSPTYTATSTVTSSFAKVMPVMTAQAVLLVPAIASPTPTPAINYVAQGPLADSAQPVTTVAVGVPPGVESGDVLVAQILVYDATGANLPTSPAGWTLIRHDAVSNGNKLSSWLYFKLAGASEPASYSWHVSLQYAAALMGAWRGASSSPIEQSSGSVAASGNPVSAAAPSLTPQSNGELQIYFYGSQGSVAPTIIEPSAITKRADIRSAKEGFSLAFGDLAAPAEDIASPTYTAIADSSSGTPVLIAQTILLKPGP
jgi:hypothetical protein